MKKKVLIIAFLAVIVIALLCLWRIVVVRERYHQSWQESVHYFYELGPMRQARKDKELLVRYNEQLACRPEKPLSEGELFARAMQDYWRHEMASVWRSNAYLDAQFGKELPSGASESPWALGPFCRYIRDPDKPLAINDDNCYPRILRQDNTLEKFYQRAEELQNDKLMFDDLLQRNEIYRPENVTYLYTPNLYNREANFAVYSTALTRWYPKDCCTIVSYEQMMKLDQQAKIGGGIDGLPYYSPNWRSDLILEKRINNKYFLITKYLNISPVKKTLYRYFHDSDMYRDIYHYEYRYRPITPCGKILWY